MSLDIKIPKIEAKDIKDLSIFCETVLINLKNNNEIIIKGFKGIDYLRNFESEFNEQLVEPHNNVYNNIYITKFQMN